MMHYIYNIKFNLIKRYFMFRQKMNYIEVIEWACPWTNQEIGNYYTWLYFRDNLTQATTFLSQIYNKGKLVVVY